MRVVIGSPGFASSPPAPGRCGSRASSGAPAGDPAAIPVRVRVLGSAAGGGYDTYFFRQGYGTLAVDNTTTGGMAAQGEVDFGPGITEQNLWFSQSGTDLLATVLGSADTVDIKGWFGSDPSAQLGAFKGYDGFKLDSQVGQLVTAMAAYAGDNPGFGPQAATAMPTNPALQTALAAAWHT